MSKSIPEISSLLNSLNAEVSIFRNNYSYTSDENKWTCTITVSTTGTELKVRAEGSDCTRVLGIAFDKLEPLIDAPAVAIALALPILPAPEPDVQF